MPQQLSHIRGWVFDLDNTLYSPYSSLFPQIHARMQDYIVEFFSATPAEASDIRFNYFKKYGTTLRGLMVEHKIAPQHFLDYVHDIDLTELAPAPALADALQNLEGKKVIFTNADRRHAQRILEKLGLSHIFEAIFDIEDGGFVCKPEIAPYHTLLKQHGLAADKSCMFEDMQVNLVAAAQLGMRTVWLRHEAEWLRSPPGPSENYPHCHYVADDLIPFLKTITEQP